MNCQGYDWYILELYPAAQETTIYDQTAETATTTTTAEGKKLIKSIILGRKENCSIIPGFGWEITQEVWDQTLQESYYICSTAKIEGLINILPAAYVRFCKTNL